MRTFTFFVLSLCSLITYGVEGYKDIPVAKDKDLVLHNIMCGDAKKPASMKQAFVFTNSEKIEEGTYHFTSAYGAFSYTFKYLEPGKPVAVRGLLRNGETDKNKMVQDVCITEPVKGLPGSINGRIKTDEFKANDPSREKKMTQLVKLIGRPVFSDD